MPTQGAIGILSFVIIRHKIQPGKLVKIAQIHILLGRIVIFAGISTCVVSAFVRLKIYHKCSLTFGFVTPF